jgi:tryptophan-rich sensory protein
MDSKNLIKLCISVILPLAIGAIAGIFTAQAIPDWYASLIRPSFNPPNGIFGPVWTTLYLLMGISLFIIWKQPTSKKRNIAMTMFVIQLLLNFCWSFLFFYFKELGLALIEIIIMWIAILIMIISFHKVKPLAAYINIPYILWVSFATILNAAYYVLNS